MAKIALGMATSHGPMLSTLPEHWHLRAKDDGAMPVLWYRGFGALRITADATARNRTVRPFAHRHDKA